MRRVISCIIQSEIRKEEAVREKEGGSYLTC